MQKTKVTFIISLWALWALLGCDPQVKTSIKSNLYKEEEIITKLLRQTWLVIPFVTQSGDFQEIEDRSQFKNKINKVRPSHRVIIFGENPDKLSKKQVKAHKAYQDYIRQNHQIPDSLVSLLRGEYEADVLITPIVFNHQVTQTSTGAFQRRLNLKVKIWDTNSEELVAEINSTSTHSAPGKQGLVSPQRLFNAGLEAFCKKLLYHPFANLAPQSQPDF